MPLVLAAAKNGNEDSKPNILFLFTDDQDYELGSLDFLPITRERILDQGNLAAQLTYTLFLLQYIRGNGVPERRS